MEKRSNLSKEDADKEFKKGEAAIKTGVFKWSADYMEGTSHFEKAAKAYKNLGEKKKAIQAYLKYSLCSEKQNEFYGAAEGLAEAAFLETDKQQSREYLLKAQNYYKIQGIGQKGQADLKRFAQKLLDSEDDRAQELALDIYQGLFEEVFEGDNFLWNPDIVNEYINLLMKLKQYQRVIEAKKSLIKHLRSQGTIDHQIRRSWLEIVIVQILAEDYYTLADTLQSFAADCPSGNPYQHDEYNFATALKDAITNKDYAEIVKITKKPLFGFLDNEIVKQLKIQAMNPPTIQVPQEGMTEEQKRQQVLNQVL